MLFKNFQEIIHDKNSQSQFDPLPLSLSLSLSLLSFFLLTLLLCHIHESKKRRSAKKDLDFRSMKFKSLQRKATQLAQLIACIIRMKKRNENLSGNKIKIEKETGQNSLGRNLANNSITRCES
jgi:hypothetical protein